MGLASRGLVAAALAGVLVGLPSVAAASPGVSGSSGSSGASSGASQRPNPQLSKRGVADVCGGIGPRKLQARCQAKVLTVRRGSSRPFSSNKPAGLGAGDLARAYQLPAKSGGGKTIAILDGGRDFQLASDLANYRYMYNLPQCTKASGCLSEVSEDGGRPLPRPKNATQKAIDEEIGLETSLDVDMASAACPNCNILVVDITRKAMTASDNTFARHMAVGVQTALRRGASAVSMSYQSNPTKYADTGFPAAALDQAGTAVLAASGDYGVEGQPGAQSFPFGWPQDLPWVISVGGTSLYNSGSSPTGYVEQAWQDAGSGCSSDLGPGIGQPAAVAKACDGNRAASDVSALADPYTGASVYDTYAPLTHEPYNWIVVGGTSAATPFLGGLFARGGNVAGVHGPNTIYAQAGKFADITLGQNAPQGGCKPFPDRVCVAGPGWDGPTGVGAPRGLDAFH